MAPTINGYRRYRANSLAPDRAAWSRDNRGALLRVIGDAGPATRIENRGGEPAANPYLYMGAQILTGMAGLRNRIEPGAPVCTPYQAMADLLPTSLDDALVLLDGSKILREGFGDALVDTFLMIKRAELARFHREVTEWEHREYFDLF
jgi:glutamine synthetase